MRLYLSPSLVPHPLYLCILFFPPSSVCAHRRLQPSGRCPTDPASTRSGCQSVSPWAPPQQIPRLRRPHAIWCIGLPGLRTAVNLLNVDATAPSTQQVQTSIGTHYPRCPHASRYPSTSSVPAHSSCSSQLLPDQTKEKRKRSYLPILDTALVRFSPHPPLSSFHLSIIASSLRLALSIGFEPPDPSCCSCLLLLAARSSPLLSIDQP